MKTRYWAEWTPRRAIIDGEFEPDVMERQPAATFELAATLAENRAKESRVAPDIFAVIIDRGWTRERERHGFERHEGGLFCLKCDGKCKRLEY